MLTLTLAVELVFSLLVVSVDILEVFEYSKYYAKYIQRMEFYDFLPSSVSTATWTKGTTQKNVPKRGREGLGWKSVHSSKYRLFHKNFPNLGPKERVIKYMGMATVLCHNPKKFLTNVKLDENVKSYFDSQK